MNIKYIPANSFKWYRASTMLDGVYYVKSSKSITGIIGEQELYLLIRDGRGWWFTGKDVSESSIASIVAWFGYNPWPITSYHKAFYAKRIR